MNTANLQLEGLYAALSAILNLLRDKELVSQAEIEEALAGAEAGIDAEGNGAELSHANLEAARFPIRFLRLANQGDGLEESFLERTRRIGLARP